MRGWQSGDLGGGEKWEYCEIEKSDWGKTGKEAGKEWGSLRLK